jgi:hypothetical protein
MSTENSNPEADNEVPPVARVWGLTVSEWVVYSFVVITAIATIVGYVVGGERDVQAERAMVTLAALTEEAESRVASGGELLCDNTLLDSELLANDYLTLSISQAPINEKDESLGYGPALLPRKHPVVNRQGLQGQVGMIQFTVPHAEGSRDCDHAIARTR